MASETRCLKLKVSSPSRLAIENGGRCFDIHPIWLRERCQDSQSIDLFTGQRLQDPSDLALDLGLESIAEIAPGQLRIRFSDGHEAQFDAGQILAEAALEPGEFDVPPLTLWTGALTDLPRARWSTDPTDAQLESWMLEFLKFGFIVFTDVPARPQEVLRVAQRFGFTRETNFGALFDVRSVPEAIDLAYTPMKLDPHTDNPYRAPVPGVQLLHCLVNETTGGLSTLVDGFSVAETLRARDPAAFKILTETSVRFRYRDKNTELVSSAALIELDVCGRVRAIHFSPRLDYVPLLPPEELAAYYRARRSFDHLLREPEFEIRFLLNAGDLVMFDNVRLLHGRTGFNPAEGLRHLQGCYIDIDGPRSVYRMTRRKLAAHTEVSA